MNDCSSRELLRRDQLKKVTGKRSAAGGVRGSRTGGGSAKRQCRPPPLVVTRVSGASSTGEGKLSDFRAILVDIHTPTTPTTVPPVARVIPLVQRELLPPALSHLVETEATPLELPLDVLLLQMSQLSQPDELEQPAAIPATVPAPATAFAAVPAPTGSAPAAVPAPATGSAAVPAAAVVTLDHVLGHGTVVQNFKRWFGEAKWKTRPAVLWGPCGIGKSLLASLLPRFYKCSVVSLGEEEDAKQTVQAWLNTCTVQGLGLDAYMGGSSTTVNRSWLLLDSFDLLQSSTQQALVQLLKPHLSKLPAPVLVTCNNVYDDDLKAFKGTKDTSHLFPMYALSTRVLQTLCERVAPELPRPLQDALVQVVAGDGHRLVIEAQLTQRLLPRGCTTSTTTTTTSTVPEDERVLHDTPHEAVKKLFQRPTVSSRELDGREFLVSTLMWHNYVHFASNLDEVARAAHMWVQKDMWDVSNLDHTENWFDSSIAVTYNVPALCTKFKRKPLSCHPGVQLNRKLMGNKAKVKWSPEDSLVKKLEALHV